MKRKLFLKLLHNKKWHKDFKWFRNKMMLYMLVPILLLGFILAMNYARKTELQNQNSIDLAYQHIMAELDTAFTGLVKANGAFHRDHSVNLVQSDAIKIYSGVEQARIAERVKKQIQNAGEYIDTLEEIELYSDITGHIMSTERTGMAEELQPQWYKTYKETGETEQIYADDTRIIVTYPTENGGVITGMLILKLSKQRLADKIKIESYNNDIGIVLNHETSGELFRLGNVNASETRTSRVTQSIDMTYYIGDKSSTDIMRTTALYSVVYLVAAILIAYVIAALTTTGFYRRFFDVSLENNPEDESAVKVSENAVLQMDNEDDIKDTLPEKLARWNFAQVQTLQMQINPHFVFNVLDYVNLDILGDDETKGKSSRIIILLSKVLGYAMREPQQPALIVEEIKMTKKYIEIEQIKTDNGFDVVWDIDKAVLDKECIKLFLQPIVENSIMHAVKGLQDRRGRIEITATMEKETICFTVVDNGNGMTQEQLEEVRARLKSRYGDTSKHIGLRNVNERIRLLYGEGYGVSIDSGKSGTKVTIKFGTNKGV